MASWQVFMIEKNADVFAAVNLLSNENRKLFT